MELSQMIRADHANTRELCREIRGAIGSGVKSRPHLIRELDRELGRQMRAEEEVIYMALKRHPEMGAEASRIEEEHERIRDLLDLLVEAEDPDGRDWTRRFDDLMNMLERHFGWLERQIMPALDPREADMLRKAYEREKIASLEAERWHMPTALMPRRYGVSNGLAVGLVAGVAGLVAAAALRNSGETAPRSRQPNRGGSSSFSGSPFLRPGSSSMQAHAMISTHPNVRGNTNEALIRCIEECYACAQVCTSCADACLAELMVEQLRQCIRLNLDCADVCAATGAVASRRTGSNEEVIRRMLEACATACRLCGQECERHAGHHEHCRICAESCRRCEQACREALRSM